MWKFLSFYQNVVIYLLILLTKKFKFLINNLNSSISFFSICPAIVDIWLNAKMKNDLPIFILSRHNSPLITIFLTSWEHTEGSQWIIEYEDDLKYEDNLKFEENLKYKDNLKYEDDL